MDFKTWWPQYGDMVVDVLLYLAVAGALIWFSKLFYDIRQDRRDRKAAEAWYRQKEEEQAGKG